jgi:endonuclease YncB( thermonuclease family)
MGSVLPFRRLRAASTPRVRVARRTPISGFLALAALLVVAAFYSTSWLDVRGPRGSDVSAARTPSPPTTIGRATVIDGDSLRVAGEEIRLIGIDAPEYRQTCRNEHGRDWACGREARAQLVSLLAGHQVRCAARGRDRFARTLAVCAAGNVADIGEALVRTGYAVDFMDGAYRSAEAEARAAKRGIWRGEFEWPQAWRARNRRAEG